MSKLAPVGTSENAPRDTGGERLGHVPSAANFHVLWLVDALRARGVTFTLDRHAVLVFDPPGKLAPKALELVEVHRAMLTNIVIGRLTGHAPGTCSVCGEIAMIRTTNTSGTRRTAPSVGWPKCKLTPRCAGLVVVADADLEGVARTPRPKRVYGPPRPWADMRWLRIAT